MSVTVPLMAPVAPPCAAARVARAKTTVIAAKDFRQHTSENGLFTGDLRLEGSHIVSNAYPIYTDKADERATNAIAALRAFGVESLGRQGAFDYQPTARDTTLKAEAALRRD